jgi:hypothetical protein
MILDSEVGGATEQLSGSHFIQTAVRLGTSMQELPLCYG